MYVSGWGREDLGVPRRSPVQSNRYSAEEIIERIARMRVACGVEPADIYRAIGMSQSAWSKKWNSTASSFNVQELGAIAEYFSKLTGKPLTGWPIVDVEVSGLLDTLSKTGPR